MPSPSTWPFRLEQQDGISQGFKEDSSPKVRRSTDKGHGPDSVNECIELVTKLKLCTNLQIGRAAAIISTADEGPRAQPNDNEDPEDPSTIADDNRTYLWKIDLTAAYRQITIHVLYLWMCHTSWGGDFLDRRMQFGDKSAVEGFQSITNLILVAAQDAIDGDLAMRALVVGDITGRANFAKILSCRIDPPHFASVWGVAWKRARKKKESPEIPGSRVRALNR